MNKTASYLIIIAAFIGVVYAGALGVAQVREWHLESQCTDQGKTALWQSSGPDDHRPDGFLPFHCVS
jgi:hypothetical protein